MDPEKLFGNPRDRVSIPASEVAIEQELRDKGKNAPRLTPEMIEATIVAEYYHRVPGATLTLCVLTTRNGFQVVGHSAAASPDNFDEEIGKKLARSYARNKIWQLEGYLLRERLSLTAAEDSREEAFGRD